MKKFLFVSSAVVSLLIIGSHFQFLQSKSNGSIVGYSGAPKATSGFELTCTNCHGGTANTGPHSLEISIGGNPSGFQPGQAYTVTAKIVNPTGLRAGFSLVCLDPAKANCGLFTVGTGTRIVSSAATGRSYINHSGTNLKSWTFTWTAPSTNVPDSVTFYMASLEVTSADYTYTKKFVFRKQQASAPVLSTTSLSNLTQTTVSSGGNITNDGGNTITERGVCWSASPGPTTSLSSKTSDGTGPGTFISNVTGLSPSTTYYLRSYATNSLGTSYGQEINFTTPSCQYLGDISGSALVTCANPSTTLSISGGGSFLWSTGASTPSITVNPVVTTTYSVIGTLGNGCSDTSTITVNVDQTAPPVPVITAPSVAFCAKTQAIQSSAPTGNQWQLNGVSINGANATAYWPVQSGSYSLMVTNPLNGCSSVSQIPVSVTVLALPVISQQPAPVNVPTGAVVQFTLASGGAADIYRWQSGSAGLFSDLIEGNGVSGVGNDTLRLTAEASQDGKLFRCIVSDATCPDTSIAVALSVITANQSRTTKVFEILPNPAKTHIRFSGIPGPVSFKISGSDGRLLLSGYAQENAEISLKGLAPGCYLWQASGSSGKAEFGRFILEP